MDFFGQQDKAKAKTFWLFILFIIGLLLISILATSAINLALVFSLDGRYHRPISFVHVIIPVVAITLLVTFYKYLTLRPGGKVVAEALGSRLLDKRAANASERRLLNVVEEMAIAANLPVPPIYILDEELNINAFAAGFTINDAVIGVTKGTIELLDRDELQAVIGHEFSHILHGDMRLNLRFTALLFGFLFIMQIATLIFRAISKTRTTSSLDRDKKAGGIILAIFLISCILMVAGWISSLWARIMQAAINRQREYLADASSVQFTRHGPALASALKKIGGCAGGSTLAVGTAKAYNHFFFGQADSSFLATHPPLEKRIRQIEPNWDGNYIIPNFSKLEESEQPTVLENHSKERITAAIATAIAVTSGDEPIPYIKPLLMANSSPLDKQQAITKLEAICQEPMDACYLIFALLLDTNPTIRTIQFKAVKNNELIINYYQLLASVPIERHLEFIEKMIPALKKLSTKQYQDFKKILIHFINADNVISLPEWLVYQLIIHQVGAQFDTATLSKGYKYNNLSQLTSEVTALLSAIAHLSPNEQSTKYVFGLGANKIGLYNITLQEPPTPALLTSSLQKLQQASEAVRKRFLEGALAAIQQDQQITNEEAMFFRVLSLCLDCPVALPKEQPPYSNSRAAPY